MESFALFGGSMKTNEPGHKAATSLRKEDLKLPCLTGILESTLSKGNLLQVDGTNVVRVPFGIRQPLKKRPERPERMATLVIPFNTFDSPNPPPQAA